MLKKQQEMEKNDLLSNVNNINKTIIEFFQNTSLDIRVIKFFLKQLEQGNDTSPFLRPDIKDFSFEQIKYLFAVYTTGENLEFIFSPNLSVEQMKEKMINAHSSTEFLNLIINNHDKHQGRGH